MHYFGGDRCADQGPCGHEFVGECSLCPGADCVEGGVCERVDLHLGVSEDAGRGGVDCVVDSEEFDVLDPFFLDFGRDVDGEAPIVENGLALDGVG